MLQTTFINFRTLSFAMVMVAMLGVGTMTPVHQAAAQEATSEQRAAMLEQISVLMRLIEGLQEQILIKQRKQYESIYQTDTNVIHSNSYVEATQRANVYKSSAGEHRTGNVSSGEGGDVIGGPRLSGGDVWWEIEFEDTSGWVAEHSLERIPSVVISIDKNGDGVKERVGRLFGDYSADRVILYPTSANVIAYGIENDNEMIGKSGDTYVSGQIDEVVDGEPLVLQSNPYNSSEPFVKGEDKSIPIAWQAQNVPMQARFEIQVEAVRLVDSPLSGGTWGGNALVGDSVSLYYYSIEGPGRIGAGDYRSQVRIVECGSSDRDCKVLAESPYRYFTIVNKE